MDGPGFDALTRAVSGLRSRRGLAQVLLGAVLGGAPVLAGLDEAKTKRHKRRKRHKRDDQRRRDRQAQPGNGAQADKRKKKKACPPCKKRKQGKCKGKLPDGTACPGGSCQAGRCVPTTSPPVCTPTCGERACGGDDGCGQSCACPDGLNCKDGQCVLDCGSERTDCSGTCVDLQTDENNCGTCGEVCSFPHASAACRDGICTLGACEGDWRNCDSDDANGCATDTSTDLANCGACGNTCTEVSNATVTCANGGCGFTCNASFHRCNNECVSNNDVAHCGSRCDPCPTPVCSEATCNGVTCGLAPIPGCCETDGDCDDANPCTTDICGADHTCEHTAVICPSSDPCQDPVCDPGDGCTIIDHCQANEVCIAEGAQAHCCPQTRPLWDGAACLECTPGDLSQCPALPNAETFCDAQGTCDFTCLPGWAACGRFPGCQTSLAMYPICGACDNFCRPGEECVDGNCRCGEGPACTGQQRCCVGVCLESDTDVNNCGLCGNVCTGVGKPNVIATCSSGFCSVGCQGQNYDVNNDLSDGCEHLDTQENHTQETALDLGARSCLNTDFGSFTGTIFSDKRTHLNPRAPGIQVSPGANAAPLWFKVASTGGDCEPDLRVELTLTSGSMNTIYQVTVITDLTEATATVVNGSAIIALEKDSYTPGAIIYFKVEKKYLVLNVGEVAGFTAVFHL